MIIANIILDREREKAARQAASEATSDAYRRVNEQIKAYHDRMRAALDAGEDFTEPPPQFGKEDED